MSAYSTESITREEAENLVKQVRAKLDRSVKVLSDEELLEELHEYVYSEEHWDILPCLINYQINALPRRHLGIS